MRTPRPPFRSRGPTIRRGRYAATAAAVAVAASAGACATPRGGVESFPPIVCAVEDADGSERSVTVEVDGTSSSVEVGDLTFGVDYRSHGSGRVLETSVRRSSGELVERVTYLVPGQTLLNNQFGPERSRLTGQHELDAQDAGRILWSCSVGRGGGSEEDAT